MITNLENIGKLVGKYLRQELTEKEQKQLNEWINESDDNKQLFEKWTDAEDLMRNISDWERLENGKQNVWQKMDVSAAKEVRLSKLLSLQWWKYAVAVAVVIFLFAGAYFLFTGKNEKPEIITQTENNKFKTDKNPGKDGAILTLADGKQIVLDDAANGNLATQGKTEVLKKDGMLSYSLPTGREGQGEALYNTLSTPRGRQFQLLLPDGSRVWLNAASSVRYPTVFAGKERVIEISGEAYMEIAKDASRPFKVHVSHAASDVNGVWVEVLGTHFNVKAYEDEASVSTTLIEGKVKIKSGSSLALLTPGKQAIISPTTSREGQAIKVNPKADIEEAIAWKNGMIVANRATVKEALKQISRWYDIDLVFKNEIKEEDVRIRVPRNTPLLDVLKIFELSSRLRFTIEGNKLIVSQLAK